MSPVCVTGMHRSGTSMVARVLSVCGLDLGDAEDLMAAAPDNPEGFWEHRRFVALDDELLQVAGGSWDSPPIDPAWARARFDALREDARRLVARFGGREPWGWKDPRTSLTAGFWLGVLPELRVVVVVRNPLEVAWSLRRRNGIPLERGLSLWWTYHSSLVEAADLDRRIVCRYERFLDDGRREVRRAVEFAGLHPEPDALDRACLVVEASSRHTRFTTSDLTVAGAPGRVSELYRRLLDESDREPEVARP